jgi:predicted nucleotidyltransferase
VVRRAPAPTQIEARLRHLSPAERRAVARFQARLERDLPGCVERLILYGSKARGDARPGSDMDLLLVVPQATDEVRKAVRDITADILMDEGMWPSSRRYWKRQRIDFWGHLCHSIN